MLAATMATVVQSMRRKHESTIAVAAKRIVVVVGINSE
jgi:hypothetical protein